MNIKPLLQEPLDAHGRGHFKKKIGSPEGPFMREATAGQSSGPREPDRQFLNTPKNESALPLQVLNVRT